MSELLAAVQLLEEDFNNRSRIYLSYSMKSRPEWIDYYNNLAFEYLRAATYCNKYCDSLNLLQFVQDIKNIGFSHYLSDLKQYIDDPTILQEINVQEELI